MVLQKEEDSVLKNVLMLNDIFQNQKPESGSNVHYVERKSGHQNGDLNLDIGFVAKNISYYSIKKRLFIKSALFVERFFIVSHIRQNIKIDELVQRIVAIN